MSACVCVGGGNIEEEIEKSKTTTTIVSNKQHLWQQCQLVLLLGLRSLAINLRQGRL